MEVSPALAGPEPIKQSVGSRAVRIKTLDPPQAGRDTGPEEKRAVASEAERDVKQQGGGTVRPDAVGRSKTTVQFACWYLSDQIQDLPAVLLVPNSQILADYGSRGVHSSRCSDADHFDQVRQ